MEETPVRSLAKNSLWLVIGEAVNGLLMFFLTIWLARYLGAAGYGQLTFALSFVALFAILADLGLSPLVVREIARNREATSKYLGNIITIKAILGVFTLGLLMLVAHFSGRDTTTVILISIIGVWEIFHSAILFFRSVFRAHEKMSYETLVRIVHVLILFIFTLYFIGQGYGLVMFGVAYLVAGALTVVVAAITIWRKFSHFRLRFDFTFWKELLSTSWPFALTLVFTAIYYYLDSVMLGLMKDNQTVGWYNAAYKPVLFFLTAGAIFPNAAFPIIARLYKGSLLQLQKFMRNLARLITIVALPMVFGTVALASPLVKLLYGPEYLAGVLALQILIGAAGVIYISMVYGPSLQACNKQKTFLWGVGMGALVNIALNFLLIPKYSLYGAAVATLLTEVSVFVFIYVKFNRQIVKVKIAKHLAKPLVAAVSMFLLLYFLPAWNIFILGLIGGVSYLVVMILIKGIRKEDLLLAKRVFGKAGTVLRKY